MTTFQAAGVRWSLAPGETVALWRDRLTRAVARIESGEARNEKSGRRKELYRVALTGDAPDHLVKVNRYPRWAGWRRRLAGSKAARELERAQRVAALGIPTPVPSAAGERVARGRLVACYLVVPIVPGAVDLREVWRAGPARATRIDLARRLGGLVRDIHAAGIDQDDLAPNNFLVTADGELQMIDFERARLGAEVSIAARNRALAKLDRELAGARLGDRARFVRAYVGTPTEDWKRLWRALEREAGALAARDVERLVRVTGQPGRRFRALRHDGWRGSGRAELDPGALGAALDALLASDPVRAGDAFSVRAAGDWWAIDRPVDARAARVELATAEMLARRALLAPRPLARLSRGRRSLSIFQGSPPGAGTPPASPAAALASVTVLLDRLLALGSLHDLELEDLGLDARPAAGCARPAATSGLQLRVVCRFVADGGVQADRHVRARASARRLLGLD